MSDRKSTFENVIKWIVIAILAIVALKVVATILGIAFFIGGFLFFRVLPLVLLVWTVVQVLWVERAIDTDRDPIAPVVEE